MSDKSKEDKEKEYGLMAALHDKTNGKIERTDLPCKAERRMK